MWVQDLLPMHSDLVHGGNRDMMPATLQPVCQV
jgi:hypothetical protein